MSFLNTAREKIVKSAVWLRELQSQLFPKDRLRSIGSMGTKQSGNYLYEEQLSSLQNLETRCNVFDKMIRAEAVVRLSLQCWKVPVKAAKLDVTMPQLNDDAETQTQEISDHIKDHVKANLQQNFARPWQEFITEVLSMLDYGFSVFEIIWEERDGVWWVKDLEYRHPRTILWQWDANDKLIGIKQTGLYGQKRSNEMIPIDKLLIFSLDKLGNNYEGVSMCRYAYRPWLMKQQLYDLIPVGFDRFLVKTPLLEAAPDSTEADQAMAQLVVTQWRSHENAGGVLPPGWKWIDTADSFAGAATAITFAKLLNDEMFWAFMTHWAQLGMNGVGSLALSEDQTDFFNMALRSLMQNITDTLDYVLIPKMVDYNYPDDSRLYPETAMHISKDEVQAQIDNILKVNGAGLIPTYRALQDHLVAMLDIPEPNWDEIDGAAAESMPAVDESDFQAAEETGVHLFEESSCQCGKVDDSLGGLKLWRELTPAEERAGGIKTLEEKDKFTKAALAGIRTAIKPLIPRMTTGFMKAAQGKTLEESLKLEVPGQDDVQKIAARFYDEVISHGIAMIEKENKKKLKPEAKARFDEWGKNKAILTANQIAGQVKDFVIRKGTDNIRKEKKATLAEEVAGLVNGAIKKFRTTFQDLGK